MQVDSHRERYCDECLTRVAVLALRLRKLAVAAHRDLGHAGPWERCHDEPCVGCWQALLVSGVEEDLADGDHHRTAV